MTDVTDVATDDTTAPGGQAGKRILEKMLDRLFAALVNGPSLNCRPHHSRQRVDFAQLKRLADVPPEEALRRLLDKGQVTLKARVPQPKRRDRDGGDAAATEADAARAAADRTADETPAAATE